MSNKVGNIVTDNGLGIDGLRGFKPKKDGDAANIHAQDREANKTRLETQQNKLGILQKQVDDKQPVGHEAAVQRAVIKPNQDATNTGESATKARNAAEKAYVELKNSTGLDNLYKGNSASKSGEAAAAKPNTTATTANAVDAKNQAAKVADQSKPQVDLSKFANAQTTGFNGVINGRKQVEDPSKKQATDNQTKKNLKEGDPRQTAESGKKKPTEGEKQVETPQKNAKVVMDMAGTVAASRSGAVKENTQLTEKTTDINTEKDDATSEADEGRMASDHTLASLSNSARRRLESGYSGTGSGTTSGGESDLTAGLAFEISANKIDAPESTKVDTAATLGVSFINRVDGDAATDAKIASMQLDKAIKSIKYGAAKETINELIANHTEAALSERVVAAVVGGVVDEAKELLKTFHEGRGKGVYGGMMA